eukprot:scaffold3036_cov414-Prasinococcus_capsulatus_cf.AAC.17
MQRRSCPGRSGPVTMGDHPLIWRVDRPDDGLAPRGALCALAHGTVALQLSTNLLLWRRLCPSPPLSLTQLWPL